MAHADTIVSYMNQIKKMKKNQHLRRHRERRFWFNVSDIPDQAQVFDVELRLYRDVSKSMLNATETIELSLYALGYGLNASKIDQELVYSYRMPGDFDGWFKFNVTAPFRSWTRFPKHNLGLFLQIRAHGETKDLGLKTVGIVNSHGSHKFQPFLIVYAKFPPQVDLDRMITKEDKRMGIRMRREARGGRQKKGSSLTFYEHDGNNPYLLRGTNAQSNSCTKRNLYVNFKELEWQDWIIQPEGYQSWYCSGECTFPMNVHMNATNHAIMQHLMHIMNEKTVKKPCCAPTQLSPIMVLYTDDHSNVVLKKYNNMMVKSCGCH